MTTPVVELPMVDKSVARTVTPPLAAGSSIVIATFVAFEISVAVTAVKVVFNVCTVPFIVVTSVASTTTLVNPLMVFKSAAAAVPVR